MIYFDKIDVSEDSDVNMTSASKVYNVGCYWYLSDKWFKFQPYVCNGCHDVLMMSVNFNHFAISNICAVDNCCIINRISKGKSIHLL